MIRPLDSRKDLDSKVYKLLENVDNPHFDQPILLSKILILQLERLLRK